MTASQRRGSSGTSHRRLLIGGLVLLLALDVVLVGWALARPGDDTAAPSLPSSAPSVTAPPTPTASPTPVAPATAPQGRLLSAIDDENAWRAITSDCASGPVALERTDSGGDSWAPVELAAPVDVAGVAAVRAVDEFSVFVVAEGGEDCTPTLLGSYTDGEFWAEFPAQLGATWFVSGADRSLVNSPSGMQPAPCDTVVALAESSASTAAVLCSTQSVFRTVDGGGTWDEGTATPGAVALAGADDGYLVARTGVAGCAGVLVTSVDSAATPIPAEGGCFITEAAGDPAEGTALAYADGVIWLWTGDTVTRSRDGGATWE